MQRTLRRIAAGLICTMLLGSGAVFAEEENTTQAAGAAELKAVVLQAGQDFDPAAGESDCKAQLDAAMSKVAEYGMNAVLMPANSSEGAFFTSQTWPMAGSFDLLGYAAEAARSQGLSFYILFDASCGVDEQGQYAPRENLSASAIQSTAAVLGEMTGNYQPDGVYLISDIDCAELAAFKGKPVDAQRLGVAKLSGYPFEHPDGTPFVLDKDYFGKTRSGQAPTVGPVETLPHGNRIKVW